jgi:hypothetical protein
VRRVGPGILWVGQEIALPTAWRAAAAIGYGLLLGVGWSSVQRDARRARAVLDGHPPAAE